MNDLFGYISIAFLIVFSAFFSATEIAFASVNTTRLRTKLNIKKSVSLNLALKIAENYENTLTAILMGNNLANNIASSIATVVVISVFGSENYAWVATVLMTLLVLTFGEIIPKVLAKTFSDKFSVAVAIPVYVLTLIFRPASWFFLLIVKLFSKLWSKNISDSDAVSEDDFENIIDIVEDAGVLDEESCDLLQNALDFDEVLAYEVITPRVDMEALDIRDPYEVNLKKIMQTTYSRLPVYEDTPDNIIGILHLNRVYKQLVDDERINIRKIMLPVTFVHKTMPLPDVLEKMKDNKFHMVVVLDEYGGTMGILTMEDVLEQLVGEIWDETDDIEREFVCIDETHFEAEGDMRIYDFFDEFDMDIDEDEEFEADNITVGGWVISMLDGEIKKDDSFLYENLKITVLDADEKRVEKIAIEVIDTVQHNEN